MSVKTAYVAVNLEQHKDEILARWRNAARQESAQSKRLAELDDKDLLDHLPAITEAMICVLRGENPSRIEDASRRHAHQRRLDGYSVLDVLWELTILRHVFLAVLREASEGVEEMAVDAGTKTILDVLDLCARASVGQHVKETEEERDVAAAKTADLEVQRQRFLGVLSHELRNQIQPILFGLQCLKDSNPSAQQLPAIEMIERQTRQQGLLLEDLLDLDRVRLGKIELNLSSVDLRECVRHGTESNQAQVNLKSLKVYQDFPEAPVYALVDRERICQVATNLMSNAVKFTPNGGSIGGSCASIRLLRTLRRSPTARSMAAPPAARDICSASGGANGSGRSSAGSRPWAGCARLVIVESLESAGPSPLLLPPTTWSGCAA